MNTSTHQLNIENALYSSTMEVLKEVSPSPPKSSQNKIETSQSLEDTLQNLFPEQEYQEKAIKRAKEILGTISDQFTDEQLRDVVTEVQFLVSTWLDDFERLIFTGLTLQELLHEKGGE